MNSTLSFIVFDTHTHTHVYIINILHACISYIIQINNSDLKRQCLVALDPCLCCNGFVDPSVAIGFYFSTRFFAVTFLADKRVTSECCAEHNRRNGPVMLCALFGETWGKAPPEWPMVVWEINGARRYRLEGDQVVSRCSFNKYIL